MAQHLYAETFLSPGLGVSFLWRYQNNGQNLLALIDPESPVYKALSQAIERFENTVLDLSINKPNLIEWANSEETLQDMADRRELRLGGAHVFQQSIELLQGMQMMTDRTEDPERLGSIHHSIGDVMGFIGQRSGSVHFLEQAALSYEQALEIRTEEAMPAAWAHSTYNMALALQAIGQLEDDSGLLKQALHSCKQAINRMSRDDDAEGWAATMSSVGNLLYLLGTNRRGARTLEQALVAYRNVVNERTREKNPRAWIIAQNNTAAVMQALGEHEEDIGALESSLPLYDGVLKELDAEKYPLIHTMVSANRASAMSALAGESDHLDMAETSAQEYRKLSEVLDTTDYDRYRSQAAEKARAADALVSSLQV